MHGSIGAAVIDVLQTYIIQMADLRSETDMNLENNKNTELASARAAAASAVVNEDLASSPKRFFNRELSCWGSIIVS